MARLARAIQGNQRYWLPTLRQAQGEEKNKILMLSLSKHGPHTLSTRLAALGQDQLF